MSLESVTGPLNRVLDPVFRPVSNVLGTPIGMAVGVAFVIAYAAKVSIPLPAVITKLFDSAVYRIFILSLIVYTANHNPARSVLTALGFVVAVNLFSGRKPFETFTDAYAITAIPPGCLNIKVFDLVAAYDNDKDALIDAMIQARVPPNVALTDEYAPLVAAHLLTYSGKKITQLCAPPS